MNFSFKETEYPKEMKKFIDIWLDSYNYNDKALVEEPFTLWHKTIKILLETRFEKTTQYLESDYSYEKVKDLPQDEIMLLVKCLGHNIGVWDLHVYYYIWFVKK